MVGFSSFLTGDWLNGTALSALIIAPLVLKANPGPRANGANALIPWPVGRGLDLPTYRA